MRRNARIGLFLAVMLALSGCGSSGGGSSADTISPQDTGEDAALDQVNPGDQKPDQDLVPDVPETDLEKQDLLDTADPDLGWECTEDSDCEMINGQLAPCKQSVCNLEAHQCEVVNSEDGSVCDDSDACTGGDVCLEGVCGGDEDLCVCGDGTCTPDEACDTCAEDCGLCSCCEAHETAGCDDPAVMTCVCALDPYCCLTAWDETCMAMTLQQCGVCPDACGNLICEEGEGCENCEQDCGCDVCGDGYCGIHESCGACQEDCGFCSTCGDGFCNAGEKENCTTCVGDCGVCGTSCCEIHPTAGCDDSIVGMCVCSYYPDCCTASWEDYCVEVVEVCGAGCAPICGNNYCQEDLGESCETCPFDCGICTECGNGVCTLIAEDCDECPQDCGTCAVCGDGVCDGQKGENIWSCQVDCPASTDCCTEHPSGGCDDQDVSNCVCELESYCCDVVWDYYCIQLAAQEGCNTCPAACGNSMCEPGESCESCPGDCGDCLGICCAGNPEMGCDVEGLRDCVCAQDPNCCMAPWDLHCALLISTSGCDFCPLQCGNGVCEHGEDCGSCPGDCGQCELCNAEIASSGCCQVGNPCMLQADGFCQCYGACDWEVADCGVNVCGDGLCDLMENWKNCLADCPTGSCEGKCGSDGGDGCYCDDLCHQPEYSDCCPDKEALCGVCGNGVCEALEYPSTCPADCPSGGPESCYGICGGTATTGCGCGPQCAALTGCCEDKQKYCGTCGDGKCDLGSGEDSGNCPVDCVDMAGTCEGICGSSFGDDVCWCDDYCEEAGDCCGDKIQFCGTCGDGTCNMETGEDSGNCLADCPA